jgi:hypothetical protein
MWMEREKRVGEEGKEMRNEGGEKEKMERGSRK